MNCYTSIQREFRDIRLVRFVAVPDGSITGSYQLEMTTVSLDEAPSYRALSYVWGHPTRNFPIVVNGERLELTENLHFALGQLFQVAPVGVWFWIDAICINQSDIAERNWQVGQMRDIFQAAESVYVSLGDSGGGSDLLLDIFNSFGDEAMEAGVLELWANGLKLIFSDNTEEHQGLEFLAKVLDNIPLRDHRVLQSIESLLDRPNWFRVWLIQEIALARSGYVLCGERVVGLDAFHAALSATYFAKISSFARRLSQWKSFGSGLDNNRFHIHCLLSRQQHIQGQRSSLLELLLSDMRRALGRPFYMASDPRDVIFALLGVASDADILGLRPDYGKPVEVIYAEATRAIMAHDTQYRLEYCAFPKDTPGLPSWVPDWQRIGRLGIEIYPLSYTDPFIASRGRTQPLPAETNGSTLKRKGINVDTVDRVLIINEMGISEQGSHAGRMTLERALMSKASRTECLKSMLAFTKPCLKPQNSEPTLWRLMLRGWMRNQTRTSEFESLSPRVFRQEAVTPSDIDERQLKFILRNLPPYPRKLKEGEDLQPIVDQFCEDLVEGAAIMARGRTLFITRQDVIGLGPYGMRDEDVVTILFGTQVPILLRPAGTEYTYVGDAYLDGAMDGECLEGDYEELDFDIV